MVLGIKRWYGRVWTQQNVIWAPKNLNAMHSKTMPAIQVDFVVVQCTLELEGAVKTKSGEPLGD